MDWKCRFNFAGEGRRCGYGFSARDAWFYAIGDAWYRYFGNDAAAIYAYTNAFRYMHAIPYHETFSEPKPYSYAYSLCYAYIYA
ncbi:MAG: hypothetical protein EOM66_02030 [Clostridia bacterium]|nr:hypothetical protein [Clostridia bacterium]